MKIIRHMVGFLSIAGLMALAPVADGREGRGEPPAEVKAAFAACAAELGIAAPEGRPPQINEEQRSQFGECLKGKGVNPPPHGQSGGRGGHERAHAEMEEMKACLADAGVELPEPQAGERPQLDESTRAAIQACREKLRPARGRNSNPQETTHTSAAAY